MLMDPMGGICMTNDGNAILREIIVQHPAAKSMISHPMGGICMTNGGNAILREIIVQHP